MFLRTDIRQVPRPGERYKTVPNSEIYHCTSNVKQVSVQGHRTGRIYRTPVLPGQEGGAERGGASLPCDPSQRPGQGQLPTGTRVSFSSRPAGRQAGNYVYYGVCFILCILFQDFDNTGWESLDNMGGSACASSSRNPLMLMPDYICLSLLHNIRVLHRTMHSYGKLLWLRSLGYAYIIIPLTIQGT